MYQNFTTVKNSDISRKTVTRESRQKNQVPTRMRETIKKLVIAKWTTTKKGLLQEENSKKEATKHFTGEIIMKYI